MNKNVIVALVVVVIAVAAVAVYLSSNRAQEPGPSPVITSEPSMPNAASALPASERPAAPVEAVVEVAQEVTPPPASPVEEQKFEWSEPNPDTPGVTALEKNAKVMDGFLASSSYRNVLQGKGPFVVLAPIDGAFNELEGGLEEWSKPENSERLGSLMLNHVVYSISPFDIESGEETVKTALDVEYVYNADNQTIGPAKILKAKVSVDDGYVYFIDKVLVPPAQ